MTNVSLHCFARFPQRFLVSLGLGIGLLTVGAIAPPPSSTQEATPPIRQPTIPQYERLPGTLIAVDDFWDTVKVHTPDLLMVTIYTPDATCEEFQGAEQAIAADKAIPQIVHFVLAEQTAHLLDFELAGYRLQPDSKGHTLTIDFRRTPDAQRHFISLSMCEQRVLFGSLQKTLTENPALGVSTVQFTERGRPIRI